MKRMIIFVLLMTVFFFTSAYGRDIKQSSADKALKVEGNITSVDTKHFIFTLKDNCGTETKFFCFTCEN